MVMTPSRMTARGLLSRLDKIEIKIMLAALFFALISVDTSPLLLHTHHLYVNQLFIR